MNSKTESVRAYDLPERVRSYDADMDVMHPLRMKMIDIALETLPFESSQDLHVLDLGVGTGVFAKRFLEAYGKSRIVALDGAAAMLDVARVRLQAVAARVEYVEADFRQIPDVVCFPDRFDAVISSYALHHLDASEKLTVLKRVVSSLKPNGWFINADLVKAKHPSIEQRIQAIRVQGVTSRASKDDERFNSSAATIAYLDSLEANERDQPQAVATDLNIIRESGIENAEILWKEYREVVIGGTRTDVASPNGVFSSP